MALSRSSKRWNEQSKEIKDATGAYSDGIAVTDGDGRMESGEWRENPKSRNPEWTKPVISQLITPKIQKFKKSTCLRNVNSDRPTVRLKKNPETRPLQVPFHHTMLKHIISSTLVQEKGQKTADCNDGSNMMTGGKRHRSKAQVRCEHKDQKHYSNGMCKKCYHK